MIGKYELKQTYWLILLHVLLFNQSAIFWASLVRNQRSNIDYEFCQLNERLSLFSVQCWIKGLVTTGLYYIILLFLGRRRGGNWFGVFRARESIFCTCAWNLWRSTWRLPPMRLHLWSLSEEQRRHSTNRRVVQCCICLICCERS